MNTTHFSITDGLLNAATQCPSPNFNARPAPPNGEVSLIVIHNISLPPGEFGATDANGQPYVSALFTNCLRTDDHPYFKTLVGLKVSAHLLILRTGKVIQYVNFNDRAWHAGQSAYLGRGNCNDFSIGIELEGTDSSGFSAAQYSALANIVHTLNQSYPHTRHHLAGHSDIAPGRKTDPGDFDWQQLRKLLAQKAQKQS